MNDRRQPRVIDARDRVKGSKLRTSGGETLCGLLSCAASDLGAHGLISTK